MEELKFYIVEFEENSILKPKVYPSDCAIGRNNRKSVIIITHDECTFSANDRIQRAWIHKGDIFLRLKGRGQGIIIPNLFFLMIN